MPSEIRAAGCRAGLRTLIVTGDYHHTALAVGRGVGMIPPQARVVIINTASESTRHTRRSSGGQTKPSALKAPDKGPPQAEGPGRMLRAVSFAADLCKTKEREHQGLLFHLDNANPADDDARQALVDIAAVSFDCRSQNALKLAGADVCRLCCSMWHAAVRSTGVTSVGHA